MDNVRSLLATLLLSLVFLSACSSSKQNIATPKKTIPSWYLNTPLSTSTMLYATGEGKNRDDAIVNALNMMASMLSVSIESKYKSKVVENKGHNNSYQESVSNEIQSDVSKIRISNYELINFESLGFNRYIVLIKSDKQKIFNSLYHETVQKFNRVEKRNETLFQHNALKQLQLYRESRKSLQNISKTILVMNALNDSFNGNIYIEKIQSLENNYNELQSKITFTITSNKDADNLKAVIQSGLSKEKLQIKENNDKNHFILNIDSNIEKTDAYGFILARSAISITLKDYKGNIIGANKLNITGHSAQGYEIAKENVAIKLNALVLKEGIDKIIGLQL